MSGIRFPLLTEKALIDHVSTDLLVMENDRLCDKITGVITGKSICKFDEEVEMRGTDFILLIGGSAPIEDETSDDRGIGWITIVA